MTNTFDPVTVLKLVTGKVLAAGRAASTLRLTFAALITLGMGKFALVSQASDLPPTLTTLFDNHCVECHDGAEAEGDWIFCRLNGILRILMSPLSG